MTTLPDLEPAALEAAIQCWQTFVPPDRDDLKTEEEWIDYIAAENVKAVVSAYLAAHSVPEAGKAVTGAMVKRATQEFLSHRGERPERIKRGGYALWEENAPAMRAALSAALASVPAPSGAAEPVAWHARDPSGEDEYHGAEWFQIDRDEIERLQAKGYEILPLYASPQAVAPTEEVADRLYDDKAPMADGEVRMTAAEDVLAWLIIEKVGMPDDQNYTPHQAQQIISNALEVGYRAEGDLSAVSTAIGSVQFMDPPDGGDVSLAEQVTRMRFALEAAEATIADLRRKLEEARKALEPFATIFSAAPWLERQADGEALIGDVTLGHFRAARAFLHNGGKGDA